MLHSKLKLQLAKCHRFNIQRAVFSGRVAIPLHSSSFMRCQLPAETVFYEVPAWFFNAKKKKRKKKFENADNFNQGFNFESAQRELKGDEWKILYFTKLSSFFFSLKQFKAVLSIYCQELTVICAWKVLAKLTES